MNTPKAISIGVLLFVLAYLFNPMNSIMRDMRRGEPIVIFGTASILAFDLAKLILVTLAIGIPCLFLG